MINRVYMSKRKLAPTRKLRKMRFHLTLLFFLLIWNPIALVLSAVTPVTLPLTAPLPKVRQAPFCIDKDKSDVRNFKPIIDYYITNYEEFVAVSPDTYQSPTGFIKNFTLSRISPKPIEDDHPYKVFDNFFHITVRAANDSGGMEGLYVQAISAPLGIPFGEFVIDFDCGDCGTKTSQLVNELDMDIAISPCKFQPLASWLHPTVFTAGGRSSQGRRKKFMEAHFHFKYVDYPCFDVTHAHFLILAVRSFEKDLYEVFYSSLYKVNIEGVGAPYPFYYGWDPKDVSCHDEHYSVMDYNGNWRAQKNQKAKVKYSKEYDDCTLTKELAPDDITCPPGPVTCGVTFNEYKAGTKYPPQTLSQWKSLREDYVKSPSGSGKGTEVYCMDCGKWISKIGDENDPNYKITWVQPEVIATEPQEDIEFEEETLTKSERKIIRRKGVRNDSCEDRDVFAKNKNGSRDLNKNRMGECFDGFDEQLAQIGWKWGQMAVRTHGLLMIFTWTVASNCMIYSTRFLKENSHIAKGSGCFGQGAWLWDHMLWVYFGVASMFAGMTMFGSDPDPDVQPICKTYSSKQDTDLCTDYIIIHKVIGGLSVILLACSYVTGWIRPDKNMTVRKVMIGYHAISGYITKYLGWIAMFLTTETDNGRWVVLVILTEVLFWIAFIIGTVVQRMMDQKMRFQTQNRKMFPVPEAIDTFVEPPYFKVRMVIFPIFIVIQLGIFGAIAFATFPNIKDIHK